VRAAAKMRVTRLRGCVQKVPWGHVLVGGDHLLPQTAGNSQIAFQLTTGGGVDYRCMPYFVAGRGGHMFTHFFEQTRNNFQGTVVIVIHF
jgi:hypothetical protein